MKEKRRMAAVSEYNGGLLVSGGFKGPGGSSSEDILASTEIFNNGQWTFGPQLPFKLSRHCQVGYAGTAFIAGSQILKFGRLY